MYAARTHSLQARNNRRIKTLTHSLTHAQRPARGIHVTHRTYVRSTTAWSAVRAVVVRQTNAAILPRKPAVALVTWVHVAQVSGMHTHTHVHANTYSERCTHKMSNHAILKRIPGRQGPRRFGSKSRECANNGAGERHVRERAGKILGATDSLAHG